METVTVILGRDGSLTHALTRYYERHVLAWYALGRRDEARAVRAAITDPRGLAIRVDSRRVA